MYLGVVQQKYILYKYTLIVVENNININEKKTYNTDTEENI